MRFRRFFFNWSPIPFVIWMVLPLPLPASAGGLVTRFKAAEASAPQMLRQWSAVDLPKLKQGASRERDPKSGEVVLWKGALLSDVVEQALKDLPARTRAEIDLLILRNPSGSQAMIPRAFVVKYPILLALSRNQQPLGAQAPFSVMPWTSKVKILAEGAPLEAFFLAQVSEIEFANSRERFSRFQLKRRTDPAAMRGERFFVQNCVSCHDSGRGPAVNLLVSEGSSRTLASIGHPKVPGSPALTEKERRALSSYLDAFRAESPAVSPTAQN